MKQFLLILVLGLISFSSGAFTVEEKLSDKQQEETAKTLFTEIKCLVCKGESLSESNAELAVDMRKLIRKMVAEGKTSEDIKLYLTDKYGDQILQSPPLEPDTYLLWFFPIAMLALGVVIITRKLVK